MAAAAKNSLGRNIQVESVPTFYVLFLAQNGVLGGVLVGRMVVFVTSSSLPVDYSTVVASRIV
jgi:hypothetical protein